MLTQERLQELLRYDTASGAFTWRVRTSNRVRVGGEAGCLNPKGYRGIKLDGRLYLAHRLAWLYVHGDWPIDQIDHRNGVRSDNRLANLREATSAQNKQNVAKYSNNMSGLMGVSWKASSKRWIAQIQFEGRKEHLGYFDGPEAAHAAYLAAKADMHTFQPVMREH